MFTDYIYDSKGKRFCSLLLFCLFTFLPLKAQFNTDRLITNGRSALYFEDYVLSIQYFNQVISAKPYLYEPWFFRGVAKYYLDDFAGAEADCTKAIERNPYVTNCYELRGLCRIRLDKYEEAAADYTNALKYDPDNQGLWHNRVLCYIRGKDYARALGQLDTLLTRWPKYSAGYSMRAEVYMQQEGRGIGLMNKIAAYKLQEEGLDTVDANIHLGFKPDERDYGCGAQMLRYLGVHKMRLLTNNPVKRVGLEAYGLEIVENVPIEVTPNPYNLRYLETKKNRMGHTLHLKWRVKREE